MKAYSVYIRSILESGSVVTNPSLGKDKKRFESVQGYFTRRVYARCFGLSFPHLPSQEVRNTKLGIESLEKRREQIDIKTMLKFIYGAAYIFRDDPHHYTLAPSRLRGPGYSVKIPRSRLASRKFSFFVRTATIFNKDLRRNDPVAVGEALHPPSH